MAGLRIVVGCDDRAAAADAVVLAVRIAKPTEGHLVLATADPDVPPPISGGSRDEDLAARTEPAFRQAREAIEGAGGGVESTGRVLAERPADALRDIARSEDAGMIVVGSTHRGPVGRILPGSVGRRLAHETKLPIAIAPREYARNAPQALATIAVAYDGSEPAQGALRLAAGLASEAGTKLLALGVESPPDGGHSEPAGGAEQVDLSAAHETVLAEQEGERPAVELRVLSGDPAGAILDLGGDAFDLLVVGSRGRGPLWAWLLGSVSTEVAELGPWPVVIVPSDDADPPPPEA